MPYWRLRRQHSGGPLTTRPVLLLEFNELSPTLIEQFMGEGHLPNFKRLFLESQAYVTDAQEEQEALEPWIQWVTVHTGLSYDEHGVFVLGDGPKCTKPRLWDILSQHGFTNWICGQVCRLLPAVVWLVTGFDQENRE